MFRDSWFDKIGALWKNSCLGNQPNNHKNRNVRDVDGRGMDFNDEKNRFSLESSQKTLVDSDERPFMYDGIPEGAPEEGGSNRVRLSQHYLALIEFLRYIPTLMQLSTMLLLCLVLGTFVYCVFIVLEELEGLTNRLEGLSLILVQLKSVLEEEPTALTNL